MASNLSEAGGYLGKLGQTYGVMNDTLGREVVAVGAARNYNHRQVVAVAARNCIDG